MAARYLVVAKGLKRTIMRTPYKNLIALSFFFLISLLLLLGLPKGAPEKTINPALTPPVSADKYFLDETPYCGPNGDVKNPDNIVVEALLREITDNFGKNWLTLDLYLVGLLAEPLTFQRSLGEQNSLEARTEVISYLDNTWSSDRITVLIVQDQRMLSELSTQEQTRLALAPNWPGYIDGAPEGVDRAPGRTSDLPCPPAKTDDIRAIEKALEKCGQKTPPEVSCDCEEGIDACAYLDTRTLPHKILLCHQNCDFTEQTLQSAWVHELIHALQFGCRKRDFEGWCRELVELEYLAYLCQGECNSVIDCCREQAFSNSWQCSGFLKAFQECVKFSKENRDWVEHAHSCCPNPGAPDSYGACKDIRNINPETGEESEGSDGICDAYQNCDFGRHIRGICPYWGPKECCDSNPEGCCDSNNDGIGDCFQPIIPGVGGITPEILLPCGNNSVREGLCNPDDPAQRRVKCISEASNSVITTQVCCIDNDLCPDGPCWANAGECVVQAWCF